jgi:hypothetical protein
MKDEIEVMRDATERLEAAGIAYMLTGSMALNYYAQPRMTRDIDVVVELTEQDARRMVALFHPDYYISYESVRDSIARRSFFNLIHQASIIKVDCIVRKDVPYRLVEFGRRQRVVIEGFQAWIASKEDLMISKLLWAQDSHSEFQLRDVRSLAQTGCDRDYVEHWTQTLGVAKLWKEIQP